jgi:prevent-host-death family protein
MSTVASRELRNNTRALLERVAAGEDVTITVDGHPVATLVPVARRPRFVPTAALVGRGQRADGELTRDLDELLGRETTDDLGW